MENQTEVREWSVTIESRPASAKGGLSDPRQTALQVGERLRAKGAKSPVAAAREDRIEATYALSGESREALEKAMNLWDQVLDEIGVSEWNVTQVALQTEESIDEKIESSSIPPLVGLSEVAQILGVSKQRVSALRKQNWFPRPVAYLASGPVWTRAGVEKTNRDWKRRVGRPRLGSERLQVSVMFADLEGIAALSESHGTEETRHLLTRYFDASRALIEHNGGTIEKFVGEAVMAVWGIPVAREDDALQAVRTALDLTALVALLGHEVGAPDLQARVGVLTGEAAVSLGAEGQHMVAGDLVNTASRIQSAAAPGTVLVGDSTRRSTETVIQYEDAGTHEMKGKAEPVGLWRALRVRAGGPPLPAGLVGRFGRAAQELLKGGEPHEEIREPSTGEWSPGVWSEGTGGWLESLGPRRGAVGGFFGAVARPYGGIESRWGPALDVFARGGDLVIRIELPGMDPERDVDITLEDDALVVRGELRPKEPAGMNWLRMESRYGPFQRVIPLPKGGIEPDAIEASYRDGVLEIVMRRLGEQVVERGIPIAVEEEPESRISR